MCQDIKVNSENYPTYVVIGSQSISTLFLELNQC